MQRTSYERLYLQKYLPRIKEIHLTIMNIAVVGNVDCGKSTTIGHLMYMLGAVTERDYEKALEQAKANKMPTWVWAYLLDIYDEERESGKTSEYSCTSLVYKDKQYNLIDTPGHRNLVKEMIAGASLSDVGLLLVSLREGEFEAGMNGQTQEHLLILRGMGIKQLVVAFNKMDSIDWDMTKFGKYRDIVKTFVAKLGFKEVDYVGISGMTGENLIDDRNEYGPCLMSLLSGKKTLVREEMKVTDEIILQIRTVNTLPSILTIGSCVVFHCGTTYYDAVIESVKGDATRRFLRKDENGTVKVRLQTQSSGNQAMTLPMKNVILRQGDVTVAMGIICQ